MLPYKNRMDSVNLSWECILLDPSPPTIPPVYTGPGSLLGGHACVCSPPHLRREAARPSLPAGIYWLALCPTTGRLVRSVLTTSAPQRHLWTINSDTKAVGTTTEPTHAANWCFSMPARRRKLLKHHWRWGFSMPTTDGVICRALALNRVKVRTQLYELTRQSNCSRGMIPGVTVPDKLSVKNNHHKSPGPSDSKRSYFLFLFKGCK